MAAIVKIDCQPAVLFLKSSERVRHIERRAFYPQRLCGCDGAWYKTNWWPNSFAPVQNHDYDFDSQFFNAPAIWNSASCTAHPIDEIEPLADAASPYRSAAIRHLQVLLTVDFIHDHGIGKSCYDRIRDNGQP